MIKKRFVYSVKLAGIGGNNIIVHFFMIAAAVSLILPDQFRNGKLAEINITTAKFQQQLLIMMMMMMILLFKKVKYVFTYQPLL